MPEEPPAEELPKFHRFIDEVGDTTFYGGKRRLILGREGVSKAFGIGLLKLNEPIAEVRQRVEDLQREVEADTLLNTIPSVRKRIESGGFFFHACKDTPDVRLIFLRYLKELKCEAEVVMARKIPAIFEGRHHGHEDEFYADILSHLIKQRVKRPGTLVLNIAQRGSSTREKILHRALEIAIERAGKKWGDDLQARVVFNVQTPRSEALLNVADYLCWSVQRVFEKGETRYYDYLQKQIRLVIDLYDSGKYQGSQNYYGRRNPLTPGNKIDPPNT